MSSGKNIFMRIDGVLVGFEKHFCGSGILLVTGMITLAVVARFGFGHTFPWLEELTQYVMVWVVCMGAVISTRENDHVAVDAIFSVLPKKLHPYYQFVLILISAVFLAVFSFFAWKAVQMVKGNGQISVAMPWLKMYWLYVGVAIGTTLMCYECFRLCFTIRTSVKEKGRDATPLDQLEK